MEALTSALTASTSSNSQGARELLAALQMHLPDCHITSAGGCGSSHLSSFLNQHGFSTNLQTDSDNLRHCNRPPSWPPNVHPSCVIYLYSHDLLEVVASHYRRGQAWHQALKTCGIPRLRVQRVQQAFPPTLEAYCQQGVDLFGLEDHFHNWHAGADYQILLLKYESMFDPSVAHDLFSHICSKKGLPAAQVNTLVAEWSSSKKNRTSQVPSQCRQSGMYAKLQEKLRSLPPMMVVPGKSKCNKQLIGFTAETG